MSESVQNAVLDRKVEKIRAELALLRPFLTPQGIARLIQASASVSQLPEFSKPMPEFDENQCERGIYNER